MVKWKLKEVRNIYRFVGTEEVELHEYSEGVVFPDFCLLWKDKTKIDKKFIRELLKIKDEVEELDKKRHKENVRNKLYYQKALERIKEVLCNLSPPVQTSNSTSLTSAKQKGFNMGDKVSATPTPKSKSQRREWKW